MLSFVNNIRITGPGDNAPRPLTQEEFETIRSLFFRKSKPYFDFEEIARRIAGKGKYACKEERTEAPYRFNFHRIGMPRHGIAASDLRRRLDYGDSQPLPAWSRKKRGPDVE